MANIKRLANFSKINKSKPYAKVPAARTSVNTTALILTIVNWPRSRMNHKKK